MKFVTNGPYSTNIGSRVYLMDTSDSKYQLFNPLNQEFTFDVDVSNLPCGLNGALYFSQMDADGGVSKYPTNKAGAKYGTGYCDAQCPHDIKFINGEVSVVDAGDDDIKADSWMQANVEGWTPSSNDKNAGTGTYGSCCTEMDIWEANSISTAYTPHPCTGSGQQRCTGTACGDGDDRYASSAICDKDGCDFNSYRLGNKTFYGPDTSFNLDTKSKMTVVTQFITADGTSTGTLSEIRRIYVQNGKVFQNTKVEVPGVKEYTSISDQMCTDVKTVFGDTNSFSQKGGLSAFSKSLSAGMVLVMSLWDDHAANMLWLDSDYPTTKDASSPGVARGTCATSVSCHI